jgi:molybdate transport system ATP-binding protein
VDRVLDVDIRHRLRRLDLEVELSAGRETVALVGPSGAGKTSVLRTIAGLLRPDRGRISVDGRTVLDTGSGIDLPPEGRKVGLVFQEGALFPHLSVAGNVAYGLRGRVPRRQRAERAAAVMEQFGIADLAAVRPERLSGGERQRVALARTVAAGPSVLLLDEPVAALDPVSRAMVVNELAGHLGRLELPAILVSHDFADVAGLAGRIAVIESGRIVQEGPASELLQSPASPFVAAFTGVNYFVGLAVRRGHLTEVRTDGAPLVSTDEARGLVGAVVPPWDVALSAGRPEGSALNALEGPVTRVVTVGNRVRVTLDTRPLVVAEITEDSARRLGVEPGVRLVATWKATGTRLVPAASPLGRASPRPGPRRPH